MTNILNYQQRKIKDISNIITGLVTSRKQAHLPEFAVKSYRILTLKSFETDGWLNDKGLETFQSAEVLDEKYLTREGDVIVRLSYPYTSIVIDNEHIGILIPSLFVVIRLKEGGLLPEYLGIYLNSDNMKHQYARDAIGSVIQIIKMSMLKEVAVDFPSLEKQEKIVELNRLMLKEKQLFTRLIEEKTKYNKEIINCCITGGRIHGN